ncbi:UDP-xylose and UDP-N-acetylglucosamine transporter [Drosophila grimshawi]|uniref:GH18667 n=1 Tax=Drosophila grimshawi TaxID=7222 RepID=B4JH39_DROGR|nr:UDP-xylose and UDP-N-acetylglucosamine transporter [Drosophila grimshawi]EDV92730.1 GH18667 [Drosophila grimshawi]
MNLKAIFAILIVFIGCCCNAVSLELIVRLDPGAGNLVTFLHFLMIAVIGSITSRCFTVGRKIALRDYALLVLLFFGSNVCNNYAFNFNIAMPLHMIFRSGTLMANMIMGIFLQKKRYCLRQYSGVLFITIGIVLCTLVSSANIRNRTHATLKVNDATGSATSDLFWWSVGITLLTTALLVSAYMSIYQELLYKRYGKHPNEALFYTHLLPLPGFIFMAGNIVQHWQIAVSSPKVAITIGSTDSWSIPVMILYLIGNGIAQYICISAVYVLTTECTSLTVTMVVTLRKFLSLIFSVLYFRNPFTISHWIGTALVFFGTILFANVFIQLRDAFRERVLRGRGHTLLLAVIG